MTRRQFMVGVDSGDKPWDVTCEHCGQELNEHYAYMSVIIVPKPENDSDLKRRVEALQLSRQISRSVLLDTDIHQVDPRYLLQHVLQEHARACVGGVS